MSSMLTARPTRVTTAFIERHTRTPTSLAPTRVSLSPLLSQPPALFFQLLLLIADDVYFAFFIISEQLRRTLELDGARLRKRSWLCSRRRSSEAYPLRGSAGGELIDLGGLSGEQHQYCCGGIPFTLAGECYAAVARARIVDLPRVRLQQQ